VLLEKPSLNGLAHAKKFLIPSNSTDPDSVFIWIPSPESVPLDVEYSRVLLSDTVETIITPEDWNVTEEVPFDVRWAGQGTVDVTASLQGFWRESNSTSTTVEEGDTPIEGYAISGEFSLHLAPS